MSKQRINEAVGEAIASKVSPLKKAFVAALAAVVVSTIALAPQAGAQVAPVDQRAVSGGDATNLPTSYTDARGHTVFAGQAVDGESVYWAAERTKIPVGAPDARGRTGQAGIVMAVEGTFETPATGTTPAADPITGSVISIQADGLRPNTVYKVSHPYGKYQVRTNAQGEFPRNAKTLVEHGCDIEPGEECDYDLALGSQIFNNFLRPASVGWNSGADHLGDPEVLTKVVGSLVKDSANKPQNYFKIEGPNAGGAGKNVKKVAKFNVTAQLAQDAEPLPGEEEEVDAE